MRYTGFGGSLFLIAVGAILAWAVEIHTEGFNLNTIGLILMVVGVIGFLATLAMGATARRDVVVGGTNRVVERETYVDR